MKLYTEEALMKRFLNYGFSPISIERIMSELTPIELHSNSLCINCDESKSTHNVCMDCIIKIGKENIELPSDEEIEKMRKAYIEHINTIVHADLERDGYLNVAFHQGAKWMRDKIQGGNK
jgi:hypothetical protein